MFRLDGKVCVVTGAASGIGEQIARAYAGVGATVVLADRDEANGSRVASEIGGVATFQPLDVTDSGEVQALLAGAMRQFGVLDVLVNNAGIGLVGSVVETSEEDLARLMDVNVRGVYLGCRHAVPIMLEQGHGLILNMGSVAGLVGIERRFAYCATKGAVIAMTRQLAVDYARAGIRCNAIAPGTVHTPFVEGYLHRFHAGEEDRVRPRLHERQPVGRMGRPEEIAALAVYLASDEAAFVTGAVFPIDGGWTAR